MQGNRVLICAVGSVVGLYSALLAQAQRLTLEAVLPDQRVVERCPLIVTLRVRNDTGEPVRTAFPKDDCELIEERSVLLLADSNGKTHRLSCRGRERVEYPAPAARHVLNPNELRTADRVFSLLELSGPGPDYQFLGPGRYTGRVELFHVGQETLVSQGFDVVIAGAIGVDVPVRDLILVGHAAFLEGRDVSTKPSHYDGRQFDGRVDVSRFGQLQKILDAHPSSTYAEWIRFWKVYYMGPLDETLRYAREHHGFPLSDNLLLNCAEGLFNQRDYAGARALAAEILRDFPDGDTRARVEQLQEKLRHKP